MLLSFNKSESIECAKVVVLKLGAILFKPRVTPYNLKSNGLNVVETSYNVSFLRGSYAYMISHIWNQLPSAVNNAPNASSFRRLLTTLNFIGCQCSNCL